MFFKIHWLEKWSFDFSIFAVSKFIFSVLALTSDYYSLCLHLLLMKTLCALLLPILLLSGCASVTVSNINSQEYLVQRRGDVISQGRLSDPTNTVLTALGLSDCENRVQYCINSVGDSSVTDNESKISALAENVALQSNACAKRCAGPKGCG